MSAFASDTPAVTPSATRTTTPSDANAAASRGTHAATPSQYPNSPNTMQHEDVDMNDGHAGDVPTKPFAHDARILIKTIQKLGNLGIDSTLRSLPKIVVTGDQSAGKSSLIEAVCNISLPRSGDTCTRCPFELVTTTGDEWKCEVSLIRKYTKVTKLTKPKISWAPVGSEDISEVNFAVVKDRSKLEHVLRLAQLAILNPGKDAAQIYRDGNVNIDTTLSFSPNIIRLDISSPDLVDLSLIDLPGAISVTEKGEDDDVVSLVNQLIAMYATEPQTIILLTVPANTDIESSKTLSILRKQKATDRTIGVITKADLMAETSAERVHNMLSGKSWPLPEGWFVCKQLSQEDLNKGVSYAEARVKEMELFNGEPWCNMTSSEMCGTQNLQDKLSKKLVERIRTELPEIKARILDKLTQLDQELLSLPEQSHAPVFEIGKEVDTIVNQLKEAIEGGGGYRKLRDQFRQAWKKLVAGLKSNQPQLDVTTPGYKAPSIPLASDDDDDIEAMDLEPSPAAARKIRKGNDGQAINTPSCREGSLPVRTPQPQRRTPRVKKEANGDAAPPVPHKFTLAEIRDEYESGRRSGLPGQLSEHVTDDISLKCLSSSRRIIMTALKAMASTMLDTLIQSVHTSLDNRTGTKLFVEATAIVEALSRELVTGVADAISHTLDCEMYKPWVPDDEGMSVKQSKKLLDLSIQRDIQRAEEHCNTKEARTGKVVSQDERKRLFADDKKKLFEAVGIDPHADMIAAIAGPFAYYDIATVRMADTVRLRIEYDLFAAMIRQVRERLGVGLKCQDAEYCAQLLAQDPAREQRRRDLLAGKAKLVKAMEELEKCGEVQQ